MKTTPKEWLEKIKKNEKIIDINLITQAYQFAEKFNGKLPFAESALTQGIAMAETLYDLKSDSQTIAAAIIYPSFYYFHPAKETIINQFNPVINKLLLGAERMEAIHQVTDSNIDYSQQKQQMDNLRKMLLAMVDDVRIVLIKVAERLAILKYLKHCPREQQIKIAKQTMHIYAPLANRLGIGHIKWLMEDFSFRYLNPGKYKQLSKALNMRRNNRDVFIQNMKKHLENLFKNSNLMNISISGRAKHIYSIYQKMQQKQLAFNEIYDTTAFRVLVPRIQDCYTALSIIHSSWEHIPKEFDDYIAKPKPNGYRSIHTVIIGPQNINVEIQIRTHKMHEEAELGVAAHWKYKEGTTKYSSYEEKINWLREVMDWQKELSSEKPEGENLYSQIFEDRVYVFTPNGTVMDLATGATALDFAYHIHTDIGHRCRGAKVNDQLVSLSLPLKTGDRVQILTTKESKPSRDWLNPELGYLKTAYAKAKVRHWFKKQNYEEKLAAGQSIWEKTYRREGVSKNKLDDVVERFNFKTRNDLLVALGSGDISAKAIVSQIKSSLATPLPSIDIKKVPKTFTKKQKSADTGLIIEGVGKLLAQLAKCCKPIPGDAIVGYITKGHGVSIHQEDCNNIQQALISRPQRILAVSWGTKIPEFYPVDLIIEANDRSGLIRDISSVLANENISIIGINTRVNKIENIARVMLTIEIKSLAPLNRLISQLRTIPNVTRVNRQ